MADKYGFSLHFITDPLLGIETANSVAKIEMAKAFCKQSKVHKLYFYNMVENKKKLEDLRLNTVSEKIILKPLFFKRYKEKTLHGKSLWSFCYKLFYASPIILLRAFFLALTIRKTDGIYIRGLESLFGFYFGSLITNVNYAFEQHNYRFGTNKIIDFFYRRVMKRARFIITVSEYTKRNWINNGISEAKIFILPSGVNLQGFEKIDRNKKQLRQSLDLPIDKKIITYAGGLYETKGVAELLHSATKYVEFTFLFVGGSPQQIQKYNSFMLSIYHKKLPNVIFKDFVEHGQIPAYLIASDILVAPYLKKGYAVHDLSSIKLAEYMASGIPVIVSDLPSIREIANSQSATFCLPDNAEDLADKIRWVFDNYDTALHKATIAYNRIQNYSWDKRAERIIALFQD